MVGIPILYDLYKGGILVIISNSSDQFYNKLDKTDLRVTFKTGKTITVSALGVEKYPNHGMQLREDCNDGLVLAWNTGARSWESFRLENITKMESLNSKHQLLVELGPEDTL
jgi:hypothetical protein